MSSRSLIVCLLPLAALLAGCDTGSPVATQANDTSPAQAEAPKPAGTLDRSHKGEAAPTTAFETPEGKSTTLAAFRGKPVLVNLWATWCGPCVAELPTLDALARSNAVRVVAVAQDTDAKKVAPFLAGRGVSLAAYRDPMLGLSTAYQANLPTTILLDAAGHEIWRVAGGFEWNTPAAAKLIAEAK